MATLPTLVKVLIGDEPPSPAHYAVWIVGPRSSSKRRGQLFVRLYQIDSLLFVDAHAILRIALELTKIYILQGACKI